MGWVWKVNIKQFLSEKTDKKTMQDCYKNVNTELKKVPFPTPQAWHRYAKLAIAQEDVNIFNMGMNALYDWADEHRVWMGI